MILQFYILNQITMKKLLLWLGILTAGFFSTTFAATTWDFSCIKTAVETRETSIYTAMQTLHSWINTAFNTRKTELTQAWSKTTIKEVRLAVNAAIKKYSSAVYNLKIEFRKTKTAAWSKFRTDTKSCSTTAKSALNSTTDVNTSSIWVWM